MKVKVDSSEWESLQKALAKKDEEIAAAKADAEAALALKDERAANDNSPSALSAKLLAETLANFMDREKVKDLVLKTMNEFHCMKQIELKRGDIVIPVQDERRHYLFPKILQTVDLSVPVALIGPAGSGKSTVLEQIATALTLPFYLQNGVTGAHELTGYLDAQGRYQGTAFRTAFEHGGLILVDEVDTSDAGALKWLNTALANGYAAFPDKADRIMRHADFRIAIAANTWGSGADRVYVGANQLDASTLDRFVFFEFNYDEKLEKVIAGNMSWTDRVQAIRRAAIKEKARIVVSPRASINGAKLLAAGWDPMDVEKSVIWKNIDQELKDRIIKHVPSGTLSRLSFGFTSGTTSALTKEAA